MNGDPHSLIQRWQETSVNALFFKLNGCGNLNYGNFYFDTKLLDMLRTGLPTLLGRNVGTSRWHFKHSPAHLRQIVSENIPAQKPKALLPCEEALGGKAL